MNALWAPITVNLLTGFLGAGKTSLLRRLLRQPDLADTAVLINEFGEVGIDHLLVEALEDDIVLLQSGCVCCTIRGDLKDALVDLHGRRQRGEVPPFTRLVIETTGLADPVPILATVAADPMLRHHFRAGNIVTVVDAINGATNLAFEECRRQVAVADRLVVAKTDIASPQAVAMLRARLSAINPTAEIVLTAEEDEVAAALVTSDVHDAATRAAEVGRWIAADAAADAGHGGHNHDGDDHGEASRHGDIRAFTVEAAEPVEWAAFGLWLSMLLNRHGADLLRVKGLVAIAGQDAPVVVQGVQHLVHKPVHLDRWPDGIARTRLVFIASSLDPARVRRSFAAFMRLGARAPRPQPAAASA